MLSILVAVFATLASGYWMWQRRYFYLVSWQCDGPLALPILGNLYSLIVCKDYASLLTQLCSQFRSPIRFWTGPTLLVLAHDREDIETIFKSSSCMKRLHHYDYIREAISDKSDGLFTSHGNKWKANRRLVGQAFGLHMIYSHLPIFNEHMLETVRTLRLEVGRGPVDIRLWLNKATVSMFLESMMGADFTEQEKQKLSTYLTNAQQLIGKRLFIPLYQNDFVWNLTPYPRLMKSYVAYGATFVDRIFACRMADTTSDLTFLDRLMHISEDNPAFNLDDVKAETTTLLYGASDTTAVTIAFTALMLAMHPECQERVYAELCAIMPDAHTPLTGDHLERMEYTDRCIKETLRIYPPVPLIGRTVEQEMKLKDVTLYPGQGIIVPIGELHRNPKYWGERANEFDPDNFLPERVAQREGLVYCPFSEGARICIAYKYASVVTRAMIFQLFRHLRFSTGLRLDELRIEFNVNVRLLNNHMVSVHLRDD